MQEKKSQLDKTIYRLYSYYNVYTDTAVSEKLNISRSAISQWRYKGVIPKKILSKYDQIISGAGEKVVIAEKPIHITKGEEPVEFRQSKDSTSLDAAYIIDLQRDKIKQQEKEIAMYKDYVDKQPLQKLQFDEITEDMSSTVFVRNVFTLKPMERKMGKFHNAEIIEQKLGLPKDHNYFAENQWFTFNEHPVDSIIDKNTLDELKKITRTLPSLFESLKFMVGSHYMTFPVIYEYKGKRVRTMCYILLDWTSSPKRILTKSIILNGET